MKNKKGVILFLSMFVIFSFIFMGCSGSSDSASQEKKDPVKIGWTKDSEDAILGNMIAILLEKNLDIPVEKSANLGGTGIAHEAIIKGELDIYPDYTGDALANVLKLDPLSDPQKAYEACRDGYANKYNITWLNPTPFNNTYALALKREIADDLGISKISDLKAKAPAWTIGSSIEFSKRPLDGYEGMIKHYGFKFKQIKPMETGLMYTAAYKGDVDVIVAFATDARIGKFNLKVLDDDQKFFPCYNAAATVRNETLDKYPEIKDLINNVFTGLDTDTMVSLNGKVDIDLKDPQKVAEEYLTEKGYI